MESHDGEEQGLDALTANVRNQEDLERDVAQQADQLFAQEADKQDERRIERANTEKSKLLAQEQKLRQRLSLPMGPATRTRLQAEVDSLQDKMTALDDDILQIKNRIEERHKHDGEAVETVQETAGSRRLANESQRDFLIRTGKITPFASRGRAAPVRAATNLQDAILDVELGVGEPEDEADIEVAAKSSEPLSHKNLRLPGFAPSHPAAAKPIRPAKRQRVQELAGTNDHSSPSQSGTNPTPASTTESAPTSTFEATEDDGPSMETSAVDESEYDDAENEPSTGAKSRKRKTRSKRASSEEPMDEAPEEDLSGIDDGNEKLYQARLTSWVRRRSAARRDALEQNGEGQDVSEAGDAADVDGDDVEEWYKPHPTVPDTEVKDGIRIPGDIYPSLFDYQKTGVQWLCELFSQHAGGIIGDEMGLGKTIQAISFLAGLHYSKKLTKPILVVAPATVLKQWVNEFHRWWPPLRVSILHTSGSGMLNVRGESRMEESIERGFDRDRPKKQTKAQKAAAKIVRTVSEKGHVLVTTYAGLQTYAKLLLPMDWDYALLDEGHKIRNPNAAITIFCKQLKTANRVILSGTPMQNNLTELWSLLDFVFPMRLGTLLDFKNQFEAPIRIGGYANASNLEVQTAYECAARLKEAITPFLLQRLKVDVAADLPKKSELVLTCKLTKAQRDDYERYLASDDVRKIMSRSLMAFTGIAALRKICNHPDLMDRAMLKTKSGYSYGNPAKSGKMLVVKNLLELWKSGGHKTLLFAQQKIMLDILEKYIKTMAGINYRRMDGDTAIERRQTLVDEFNKTPDIHVFLLTTKVGGLGVNLTGANRVIIFDPDWNPSTDTQARERAWRLGQKREVMIYRLITAGTIEEKIYHRQLFKQFLALKILKDPSQRRTFPMKDLHDLFSFGSGDGMGTETGKLFEGTETMLHDDGKGAAPPAPNEPQWGGATPPPAPAQEAGDDVRGVEGIARIGTYAGGESAEKSSGEEQRLMQRMLASSGVQSSLEHDEILHGTKKLQADPEVTKREARRFADKAAKRLDKAAEVARTVPIGTVTWTGQQGETGRPRQNQPRAGGAPQGRWGQSSQARPNMNTPAGPDFASLLLNFFRAHRGQVKSKMLIDHFNSRTQLPEQRARFMEQLKGMADLEKGGALRGNWVLRAEHMR